MSLLPSSKYLTKSSSKMIAVSVHEMIPVTSELLAKLLQNFLNLNKNLIIFLKVGVEGETSCSVKSVFPR